MTFHRLIFRRITFGIASVSACSGFMTLLSAEEPVAKSVFQAVEFNHISLDTTVPERASEFYQTHFGMTPVAHGRDGGDSFLHFHSGFLNLRPAGTAGLNHFCLGLEEFNVDAFYTMLAAMDLDPVVRGGGNLLHVNDPDGINVQLQEIAHGYGRTRDQLDNADNGTLTAVELRSICLGVTDVARSRDFYHEMFGLQVVEGADSTDRCVLAVGKSFVELRKADEPGMIHYGYAVSGANVESLATDLGNAGVDVVASGDENVTAIHDSEQLTVRISSARE